MEKIENSYLSFFTLNKYPFDEARDTSFFFESDDHLEALERLEYIVNDGNMNFGLLTGEVGSGKSMLRMVLEKKLEASQFEVVSLENSFYPFEDILYESISKVHTISGQPFFLNESEMPPRGDKYGLVSTFKRIMEQIHLKENRRFLLILDEAQQLDPGDLDELKNLTNISLDGMNLLTIILVLWSLFLEGASDAIFNHYLHADWSKINLISADPAVRSEAGKVWAAAFGQIFFTLSLGFGIMITYASYLPEKTDIGKNAFITCLVNCLYSFVAGFAVFGIVGFMAHSQGVPFEEAIKGGPQLAFVVYPQAISLLPSLNVLFGVIFFLMLVIAGLTSGISLIEAFACAITDKFDWPRGKVVSGVCILGFLGSLIFTTRAGLYILDIADHFITNYGLVIGGLLECLIIGWVLKASVLRKHISRLGTVIPPLWDVLVKFITPAILIYLLYLSFAGDIAENYEGYSTGQLLLYGVGLVFVCLVAALVLSFAPWKPEKLKRRHRPEEDELLI